MAFVVDHHYSKCYSRSRAIPWDIALR